MLWNEQSAHSVHGPFYSIKQEEVKNYSDGKNVAPCNSYNYSIPYHHFLTLLDLANASTHIVKKKKNSLVRPDVVSVTSTVIGLRHIWGKLLPYAPFKKKNHWVLNGTF